MQAFDNEYRIIFYSQDSWHIDTKLANNSEKLNIAKNTKFTV